MEKAFLYKEEIGDINIDKVVSFVNLSISKHPQLSNNSFLIEKTDD